MRNLLNLLIVNHRLVLFVVLEICALNWMASTHAMHNNRMSNVGIECSNSWLDMVGHFETYSEVMSENQALNDELARLRTQNMKLSSLTPLILDSAVLEGIDNRVWVSNPGEVEKVEESVANDFKTVFIKLGTDYRSIRYVEFLTDLTVSHADSLINNAIQ